MSQDLTPHQRTAAQSPAANNLVIAGPGSGKTKTLIARIGHLIDTEAANAPGIVAITFTNAGAKEIEKRLCEEILNPVSFGYIGTLHGYALRMLSKHGQVLGYGSKISIIGEEDATALLHETAKSLGCKIGPKLASAAMEYTLRPRTPEQIAVSRARLLMRQTSVVDFDTLLRDFLALMILAPGLVKVGDLIVDEFQDSGAIDFDIYRQIQAARRFYVGDPDQAIYSFRGGDLRNILEVARDPSFTVHTLEANFRSLPAICTTAQRCIEHNGNRIEKATISARKGEARIERITAETDQEEAVLIAKVVKNRIAKGLDPMEMAVLTRTNAQARFLAETFKSFGIDVREKLPPILPEDWKKAKLALDLLHNPQNNALASRWLKSTRTESEAKELLRKNALNQNASISSAISQLQKIDAVRQLPEALARLGVYLESVEWIMGKAATLINPTLADVVLAVAQELGAEVEMGKGVTVTTLHASKGREWEFVCMAGLEQEQFPGKRGASTTASLEEERRLFYVGITRAKNELVLSHALKRRETFGRKLYADATPSQFLAELEAFAV